MVGAAIRPVQDALCIAAFYIHDLIDRDKFDRGFLHKPIAAALVFRQKPIQRVPDILNPVRLYDISGGIDAVAFQCIIGAGGAEYDSATVEELPQTFRDCQAEGILHEQVEEDDIKLHSIHNIIVKCCSAVI